MYGIEQKILDWLKGIKNQPITSENKPKKVKTTANNYENESSETVDSKKENTSTLKTEMISTIKKYDDKLKGVVDDEFLKEMEYEPKTEQEIENLATQLAQDDFNLKKTKLDGSIENKRQEIMQKDEKIKSTEQPLKNVIDQKYENLLDSAQSKAIKNGVARSSILAETVKNLSEDKIKEYFNVDSEIASNLKDNANKLKSYENEYQTAVNALEIEKAIEIKEKIDDLNKEQQKKIDEVLKYNNSIDEKIYKLQSQGNQLPSDKEKAEYKKKMLNSALSYYYSLDPDKARSEFDSDVDVHYVLGEDLTSVVKNYLKNR